MCGADRGFEIDDPNSDGERDFSFHISEGEEFDATFGPITQRDNVPGAAGYREEIPACASARNAAARQRLAYAIDRNDRLSGPILWALGILQAEMTRITQNCPARRGKTPR